MKLYKYVGPDRVDILRNRRIRITQPGALNDPFELRPFFDDLVSRSTMVGMLDGQTIDVESILRKQLESMPKELLGGSADEILDVILPQLTPQVIGEGFKAALSLADDLQRCAVEAAQGTLHEVLAKEVGIISLSEVADNPPMWAHYAANQTGFAICFDPQHSFFNARRSENDEFYYLRKVVYREAPLVFSELVGMSGDDLMVTKRREWEYEREWRVLIPTRYAAERVGQEDDPCYLVELPPGAVTDVILGAKCSPVTELALREALANVVWRHVRVRRMAVAKDGTLRATQSEGTVSDGA